MVGGGNEGAKKRREKERKGEMKRVLDLQAEPAGNSEGLLFLLFDMLSPVQILIKTIWDHTHTHTHTHTEREGKKYALIIDNT